MKLLQLDLTDLYILILLNQGLTVTAAASRAHLTQEAVSQRLSKITYLLGVPLHEKFGRSVRLTSEGRKLADASLLAIKMLEIAMPQPSSSGRPVYSDPSSGKLPN